MPYHHRVRHRPSHHGFTLIELLIVVSIIALLIGIMLPALSGARKTAQAIKCQNNIKTLMAAIHNYGASSRDYMPYTNSQSGETGPTPKWNSAGWLYDRSKLPSWVGDPVDAKQEDVETGALWYYTGRYEMYHCPLDPGPWTDYSDTVKPLTSYTMNRAMNAWNIRLPAFRLGEHRSDAVSLWEPDEEGTGGYWNDGNNDPGQLITARHNNSGCMGIVDGSARQVTLFAFWEMEGQKPGPLYCNPLTVDGTEVGVTGTMGTSAP